jgi:cell division protein FtsI/penicillin-binding protein 2
MSLTGDPQATGSALHPLHPLHDAQTKRIDAWGRVFIALIIVTLAVQLGRVAQLKLAPDPRLGAVVGSPISTRPELTRRGDILDRRGRVIATSTIGFRLFVDPTLVDDLSTIAVELADVLKIDPVEVDRRIIPRVDRRYVVIEHLLEEWQVDAIRHARLRGVGLEPRFVRHYPHDEVGANLAGMVGFEHTGLAGFEHVFDNDLAPSPGRLTFLRDVRRRALWIDPTGYEPGRPGEQRRLSIDLVVQEIAERRLREAVLEFNAGGGRLVVLNVLTGEILALADALHPEPRPEAAAYFNDPLRGVHPALGRNRCVTDPYEPGSTFKPFIWAVATELGHARPENVLKTPAPGSVHRTSRGRSIRDAFNHVDADWRTVLMKSLNSGMAIVAERMSDREMQDAVRRFGFGSRTHCGLPGETAGIVTGPLQWSHYSQTSVAMGHEIAVTPVQMVRAFAAFARDGTLPRLRMIATAPADHEIAIIQRAISEDVALLTRATMRDAMTEGTGRRAQSTLYQLFAKSGTAQLPRKDGRGYHENRYVASFIAGAPFTDPRIVVLCVLDDPDRTRGHFGGTIAGPVVRDVIDETLTYLGVPPDRSGSTTMASR